MISNPTGFQKVNVRFRGFGKSQEREGGFGAAFLENLNACTSFLRTKATRNYKTRCTAHVSLKASQATRRNI